MLNSYSTCVGSVNLRCENWFSMTLKFLAHHLISVQDGCIFGTWNNFTVFSSFIAF